MKAQFSTVPRQIDKHITSMRGIPPPRWHKDSASYMYDTLQKILRSAKHFELPDRELYGFPTDISKQEIIDAVTPMVQLPYPMVSVSRKIGERDFFGLAWQKVLPDKEGNLIPLIYVHGFVKSVHGGWIPDRVTIRVEAKDPLELEVFEVENLGFKFNYGWVDKYADLDRREDGQVKDTFSDVTIIRDVLELCVYLNKPTTKLEAIRESSLKAKLGAKKTQHFYEIHRVVVNAAPKVVTVSEPKGGTHASPRWHERRGYWRTMKKSGKRVWVRACEVGSKSNGMVYKDYQVTTGEQT